jgi:hypothetical protein
MSLQRLVMDIDWSDLTGINHGGPEALDALFDRMAQTGFDAVNIDCLWCGTAMYHSKRIPVFENPMRWRSGQNTADQLKKWDPLARAVKLGRQHKIQVMAYYRLTEEAYGPYDGDDFFRKNPEYWWQTRCGQYRMVGWPCFNYPQVREHMMERVADLVDHGVEGILLGHSRTHIPYFVPYRWGQDGNAFGFNPPVVAEFKKRYGVDLSKFNYVEDVASADHGGLPFVYERRWVDAEPFDMWAFRRLLGEGYELFYREIRRRFPKLYIALEVGLPDTSGGPEDDPRPVMFRIDLEKLCRENIIDEYILGRNYRSEKLPDLLLPRYQHVLDSGRNLTAWLNDIFTATGGNSKAATDQEVADYVNHVLAAKLPGAVIHEAAFLLERQNPDTAWKILKILKG